MKSYVKYRHITKRPLQKPTGITTSVTSEVIDKLGCVNVNLMFGSKQFCHEVQVARGIDKSLIIGWDFLLKHSAVLNVQRRCIEMYELERCHFVQPETQPKIIVEECCKKK